MRMAALTFSRKTGGGGGGQKKAHMQMRKRGNKEIKLIGKHWNLG